MRYLTLVFLAVLSTAFAAEPSRGPTISFNPDGTTKGEIPALKIGETFYFDVPSGLTLTYLFSDEIGDGRVLDSCGAVEKYSAGNPVTSPKTLSAEGQIMERARADVEARLGKNYVDEERKVRVLYFNLNGQTKADPADRKALDIVAAQWKYYSDLSRPLSWIDQKTKQDEIVDKNDRISQLQEEIKAYAGMSLPDAFLAVRVKQQEIQLLRDRTKVVQKELDNAGLEKQLATLKKQKGDLEARIASSGTPVLLRAGVLILGEDRKPVYYTMNSTTDGMQPWALKRFQKFPVLTTNDVPYLVILGQKYGQDPQALRATFSTKAGSYIDTDPVRPVVTQVSIPSKGLAARADKACAPPEPTTYAYIDRVLQFTDRLAGETTYSVTVSGYGLATTTDSMTVNKGTTPSSQKQTIMAKTALKPLDGDAWPQVHSLYRYNLSTGVVWSTIRTPGFSRVATGNYLPAGCAPTASVSSTGSTTSTTSTTISTTCMPTYETLQVSGGPRILPALMFTFYPIKRDTQVKTVKWSEVIPAPTIGLSLTSPSDDFFLGASSELKPFRNLQLVYGLHLGRVQKLGANGFQNPFDSAAPQTTFSLHTGVFVGLDFNIDFIKSIFKP